MSGLTLLRDDIERISRNKTLSPNINHEIPESWLHFEQLCQRHKERNKKTITLDELWEDIQSADKPLFESRRDMMAALEYIDFVSPILHFNKIPAIRDIVFLDTHWILTTFKQIFRHDPVDFFEYKKEYKDTTDQLSFNQSKRILLNKGEMDESLLR